MKILPFLIPIIGGLVSCQRDPNVDPPSNQQQSVNDSIFLERYVEIDTTLPPGQDTIMVYTFRYDNLKRLKNATLTDFTFPNHIYNYNEDYYYLSNNDTLPNRVAELETEPGISYSDTTYFSYLNGFVSSDSDISWDKTNDQLLLKTRTKYTTTGSNTFIETRDSIFSPYYTIDVEQHHGTVFKTYQNDNIVAQDDTTGSTNRLTNSDHYQLSYDDKVNPFYRVDIHYPVYGGLNNSFDAQKNNIIEVLNSNNPATASQHRQYTYTYRQDGYPLTVRIKDLVDPTQNRIGLFFYSK